MNDDVLGARGRCDGCGLTLELDTDQNEVACLGQRIEELEQLLRDANQAFDECTGEYAKDLVKNEGWRRYGD